MYKMTNYFKCAEVQSVWSFYFPDLNTVSQALKIWSSLVSTLVCKHYCH